MAAGVKRRLAFKFTKSLLFKGLFLRQPWKQSLLVVIIELGGEVLFEEIRDESHTTLETLSLLYAVLKFTHDSFIFESNMDA